jgi:GntR family transcriptional regulator
MLLNLTDISDESLQSQIIRQVRAKILKGELTDGTSLPSIRFLAKEQKISVITVQRAYEILEREGLIHSRRGKGFFVSNISEKNKRELAKERLLQNLNLPLSAALAEGLSKNDIQKCVDIYLENKTNQTFRGKKHE